MESTDALGSDVSIQNGHMCVEYTVDGQKHRASVGRFRPGLPTPHFQQSVAFNGVFALTIAERNLLNVHMQPDQTGSTMTPRGMGINRAFYLMDNMNHVHRFGPNDKVGFRR